MHTLRLLFALLSLLHARVSFLLLQVMLPLLPKIVKWPICRALYVKDYSQVRTRLVVRYSALVCVAHAS